MTKKVYKGLRVFLFIAGGLFLLLVIFNIILNQKIEGKLKDIFSTAIPGTGITFSSASANVFTRAVSLSDVHVLYFGAQQNKYRHEFILPRVTLKGIHVFSWWLENNFIVNKISIGDGSVSLDKTLLQDTSVADSVVVFPFNEFAAGSFEMKNMDVRVHSATTDEISWKGNLTTVNIKRDKKEDFRFEEFKCELQGLKYYLPGSHKTISVKRLIVRSKESYALLDSITCTSDFPKEEFSKKVGFQSDWLHLVIDSVSLKGLDVTSLFNNKMHAAVMMIYKSEAEIYRDRRFPMRPVIKELPVEMLKTISQDIRVDTIAIEPSTITYEEFPEEGLKSGVIRMENTTASVYNLCNHPGDADSGHITMNAQTSLMGSGLFTQTIYLPLKQGENYSTKGSIKNLDLTRLNSSAENFGLIHIESGILNELAFEFSFNEKNATGILTGDYNNLKVDKLKMDENKKLKKAAIKTMLERAFVIPENKDKNIPLSKRTGKIDANYDPTRFTSFYIMSAILSGIRSSFVLGFLI